MHMYLEKFPLRLTSDLASIMGYEYEKMSAYERDLLSLLEKMLPLSIHELLNKEPDRVALESYLPEFLFYSLPFLFYFCSIYSHSLRRYLLSESMAPIGPAERQKFLVDALAKKATAGYVKSDPEGIQHGKIKRKAEGGSVDKTVEVETKSPAKKKEKVEISSKNAAEASEKGRSL